MVYIWKPNINCGVGHGFICSIYIYIYYVGMVVLHIHEYICILYYKYRYWINLSIAFRSIKTIKYYYLLFSCNL